MKRRIAAVVMLAMLLGLLSGCLKSTEELYALPRQSDEFYDLQEAISAILGPDAEYSAPVSGSNQQAVQLADLDGDGEEEAIAFVKTNEELPLKAYIFDKKTDSYEVISVIEGSGSSFQSVEYVQLDGAGGAEVVIGWQVSNQVLKALAAYSLRQDGVIELMNVSYSEYRTVDLDADAQAELFLLRFNSEEQSGVAELYKYREGTLARLPEAAMSQGISTVKRIVTGYVAENLPAVFVASVCDETNIVTDVFAMNEGSFRNIAAQEGSTVASTVRDYFVYAADIDGDGLMELPNPIALTNYNAESTGTFWAIEWYNLTPEGKRARKLRTYHNYTSSGGWYLVLQDDWKNLVIYRGNNVRGTAGHVFALWDGTGAPAELFTIYTFSGSRRNELAQEDGRFILGQRGDVTYSAKLGQSAGTVSAERLKELFHFIKIDWYTGEM